MAEKRSLPSVPVSEPRKPLQTGENLTKADRQELDQTNEELQQTAKESQTVFDRVLSQQAGNGSQKGSQRGSQKESFGSQKGSHLGQVNLVFNFLLN